MRRGGAEGPEGAGAPVSSALSGRTKLPHRRLPRRPDAWAGTAAFSAPLAFPRLVGRRPGASLRKGGYASYPRPLDGGTAACAVPASWSLSCQGGHHRVLPFPEQRSVPECAAVPPPPRVKGKGPNHPSPDGDAPSQQFPTVWLNFHNEVMAAARCVAGCLLRAAGRRLRGRRGRGAPWDRCRAAVRLTAAVLAAAPGGGGGQGPPHKSPSSSCIDGSCLRH